MVRRKKVLNKNYRVRKATSAGNIGLNLNKRVIILSNSSCKSINLFSAEIKQPPSLQYIDPAMIGVLVGMALMFIIICVVLRLFSK